MLNYGSGHISDLCTNLLLSTSAKTHYEAYATFSIPFLEKSEFLKDKPDGVKGSNISASKLSITRIHFKINSVRG